MRHCIIKSSVDWQNAWPLQLHASLWHTCACPLSCMRTLTARCCARCARCAGPDAALPGAGARCAAHVQRDLRLPQQDALGAEAAAAGLPAQQCAAGIGSGGGAAMTGSGGQCRAGHQLTSCHAAVPPAPTNSDHPSLEDTDTFSYLCIHFHFIAISLRSANCGGVQGAGKAGWACNICDRSPNTELQKETLNPSRLEKAAEMWGCGNSRVQEGKRAMNTDNQARRWVSKSFRCVELSRAT